jgi:trk system potassium uptake protein TrkA
MRQVAIIGLGKFGAAVARSLVEQGAEVIAIDKNTDRVEELKDSVTYAVAMNATDESALRSMNVQNVDIAVVCIGDEVEASLLATILLKKIGVKKIWSRAISPLQQEILKAVEVDAIINLEEEMGKIIAKSLAMDNVTKHIHLSPGFSIAEMKVPQDLIGVTLKDADLYRKYHLNVVAIRKKKPEINQLGERTFIEYTENVPSPDAVLDETDVMVLVGRDEDIERFSKA